MIITKKNWMQIHTYLSLFFLPAAIIYVLTGALYIFDVREGAGSIVYNYKLDIPPKKGDELQVMLDVLKENGLEIPKDIEVKIMRGNPTIGNIYYNVSIIKEKNGDHFVRATKRSIYGILLLMHKSKGKFYFDIIAIGFSISLMLFYLSGLIVTSFAKRNRKAAFGTMTIGFIITGLATYFSI
ncbi:hypothetical protein LS73_004110 [Helicobacter muridarum]|uniref:Integral membrane protein n=1 Tax=Helicobacter muridarum TaxID=216 RepID=A0A099U062_9HELI|nr:hypothetical protein [Helicobacter muridarum]TLE00599.1 hypothetical protein LS73_004110 [Helicobacter muridarum]STQ85616.1 integral membrane protein [Helicobacter muridarum]